MTAIFLARYWRLLLGGAALIGLILALVIAKAGERHWHKQYDQEAALHRIDIANVRIATAKAQADAHAASIAKDVQNAALADRIDHDAQVQIADAQRRANAYIASHGVRGASTTVTSGAGSTGMSQAAQATGGGNRRGSLAVMVAPDDITTCTTNTERLAAVRAWAMGLGAP